MGKDLAKNLTYPCVPNETPIFGAPDFPPQSPPGEIHLADDTRYLIFGQIHIGDACLIGGENTVIEGRTFAEAGLDGIIADNATCVISQRDHSLYMRNLTVFQAGSGVAVEVGDSQTDFHLVDNVVLTGGMVYYGGNIQADFVSFMGDGFSLDDSAVSTSVDSTANGVGLQNCQFVHTTAGQVGIDFANGSLLGFLNVLETSFSTVTGSTAIRVDDPDQVVFEARIENGAFFGPGTYLDGVTERDDTWEFSRQANAADSALHVTTEASPLTGTTIDLLAAQAWADIADGGILIDWEELTNAEKAGLTDADTGEVTVGGPPLSQKVLKVSVTLIHKRTSGSEIDIELGLSVDGADPTPDCRIRGISGSRYSPLVLSTCVSAFPAGTTLLPQVRNLDASFPANDIDFIECHMTVWE